MNSNIIIFSKVYKYNNLNKNLFNIYIVRFIETGTLCVYIISYAIFKIEEILSLFNLYIDFH